MDVLFEKNSLGRILQKVREVVIPLHFFNPSLAIVFTTPSVPLVGDRNPFQRELHLFPQAPSSSEGGGCNRSYSELSFRKPTSPPLPLREGPPLISVFSPQGRRGNRPTRCSNRYAIRLADHQRSAPGFCAEWDRMDMGLLMGCLRLHDICYERSAPSPVQAC